LPYDKVKEDVINSIYCDVSTAKHRRKKYDEARYVAFNLHSWFYRGTLESRIYNGTINANEIIQWGIMWSLIMDYILHHTDEEVNELVKKTPYVCLTTMMNNNKRTNDFVRNRILKFGKEKTITEVKSSM
jgi:Putative amidoligase enzyme